MILNINKEELNIIKQTLLKYCVDEIDYFGPENIETHLIRKVIALDKSL
jgi:hypothetical protein